MILFHNPNRLRRRQACGFLAPSRSDGEDVHLTGARKDHLGPRDAVVLRGRALVLPSSRQLGAPAWRCQAMV